MRRLFIVTVVLIGWVSYCNASRYAGDFMMIGAGVRAIGMGGTYASIAADGSAISWNPAGIAGFKHPEVMLMHAFLYNGLASYENLSYCQPLPNDVSIGVNYTRLTVDDIPYFNEKYLIGTNVDQRIYNSDLQLTGVPDGKFRNIDDIYQFAFAKHLHYDINMGWLFFEVPLDVDFGGNVKFIKREIKDNLGTGTGVDLGLMLKTNLAVLFDIEQLGKLNYGLNFQDVSGTDITWDTYSNQKDEVLFNTKMGVSLDQPIPALKSSFILGYDADFVYKTVHHYGIDWNYNDKANIRLGYYDKNFSAGASVKIYGVNLDYAIVSNPLGFTNRVGLRIQL